MTKTECAKCGSCCNWIPIRKEIVSGPLQQWLRIRGCKETDEHILIPHRCKMLTEENKCRLYNDPMRPLLCKLFGEVSTEGYYVPENCAYRTGKNI